MPDELLRNSDMFLTVALLWPQSALAKAYCET